MDLPDDVVEATLRQVRSVADWDASWTRTAQGFLAEARRLAGEERPLAAATARQRAAFSYHVAQLLTAADPKKTRALRASATALFAQSLPTLRPTATRVEPAWRTGTLPGYLVRSDRGPRPTPLAVILNGAGTAKEETLLWADAFLGQGIAVLALDWPGTGETAPGMRVTPDCDDLTDGLLALAKEDAGLDEQRVTIVGVGLGGALAVRCAAFDRRIAAAVAVTPPYDAIPWLSLANPVVIELAAALAGERDGLEGLAAGFALPGVVERLRCPLLVCGAARDVIVPPREAALLAAAVGELATLLWFPTGGHGLFGAVEEWTEDASRWLATVLGAATDAPSTPVDPTETVVAVAKVPPGTERTESLSEALRGASIK
jgi:alpha-beta hydrolase superfamily lysophospholipase